MLSMKQVINVLKTKNHFLLSVLSVALFLPACKQEETADRRIKQMDSTQLTRLTASIESVVKPQLAEGLTLRLWGVDSLVISPIAIDIDDHGKIVLHYHQPAKEFRV